MFEKKTVKEAKEKKISKAQKKHGEGAKAKIMSALKVVVIPLLFAGIVTMVIYMAITSKVEQEQLKTKVVVMEKSVPKNTTLGQDDIANYFKEVMVEQSAVPKSAYQSLSELPKGEFYIKEQMDESQMVLKSDLTETDAILDKYKDGYEVTAISAETFVGGVNGSVRRGDIVDIFALDPATEELVLMAENVYVSDAYDSSGNKVTEDTSVATSFNIYTTKDEVEQINAAITYGHVQMYLVTE